MALKYLEKATIAPLLSGMWKRYLDTGLDPANGKWYEQGADKKVGGLFGGLEDYPERELFFDRAMAQYEANDIQCSQAILDNRDGLSGDGTVELSYTCTRSEATTRSNGHGIKLGAGVDFGGGVNFLFAKAKHTLKFSFDYSYNWSKSESTTRTETTTFKQSVKLNVPEGEVHAAILTARKQTLKIPYKAIIRVGGFTDTWFEHRVKDRYRHRLSGAEAIARIGEWGLAGTSSPSFTKDGVIDEGILTCNQVVDFSAKVVKVKDPSSMTEGVPIRPDDSRVELVDEIKFYGDEI